MSEKPTLKQILPQLQSWCAVNNVSVQSVYDECHGMTLQEIVYYLFGVVKQASEEVVDYEGQFEELYNYVHDYFDNLDVQEEINNKLNQMASDGTLSNLLKPIIISSLPPIVVDSTDKMTDKSKMYILSTSGHLYQWSDALGAFSDTGLSYGTIGNVLTTKLSISEGDLNDVAVNTIIGLSYPTTGAGFVNSPINHAGYLLTFQFGNNEKARMQIIWDYLDTSVWYRQCNTGGNWTKWLNTTSLKDGGTVGLQTSLNEPYYNIRNMNNAPVNTLISLSTPLPEGEQYYNTPNDLQSAAYVITYQWGNTNGKLQFYYTYSTGLCWYRTCKTDGTWSNWVENTPKTEYNTTKNITENVYNNTYNITSEPNITTDTNGWIASTNDETDRTADIMAILNATGYCHLGEGTFYIGGQIEMPANSTITGCGNKTVLRALSGYEGAMIIPNDYCVVSNIKMQANGTPSENIGAEVGILIYDTKTDFSGDGAVSTHNYRCNRIEGVYFTNFNGSGIQLRGTGGSTSEGTLISNCRFERCSVGINISFFSEYHKIDTCIIGTTNHIGVINNGGNNNFVNCTLSGSNSAFVIDNSDGSLKNEAHGLCVGCCFNHTGGNTGDAIRILGTDAGFLFSGCEFWYGIIRIDNSKGVTFNGIHGGGSTDKIIVTNSAGIMFNGMQLNVTPEITSQDNTNLRFINCYNYLTGETISA